MHKLIGLDVARYSRLLKIKVVSSCSVRLSKEGGALLIEYLRIFIVIAVSTLISSISVSIHSDITLFKSKLKVRNEYARDQRRSRTYHIPQHTSLSL